MLKFYNKIQYFSAERLLIGLLLVISVALYYSSPLTYSFSFCLKCFIVFVCSAIILLSNNIRKYKTIILFELLFTLAFFFTNFAYPVFLYSINPYFSLFLYEFNEDVISRATAIATIGFCSYSLTQYEVNHEFKNEPIVKSSYSKVSSFELLLLFILLFVYVYRAIPALVGGNTYSGGAAFFRIFAIFLCFKRLYNHDINHTIIRDIILWSMIVIYIVINLLVGNRGDPMYVIMAFFISYELFIHHISYKIFIPVIIVGFFVFFIIGQVRNGDGRTSMVTRILEVDKVESDNGILMYGEQFIINNRTLYVLVDYADKNGLNYGQTWQIGIYSIVPFLQSFMLYFFDITPESFGSVFLTTYLEFGRDNPEAFGLGTNLIGDIYICYGLIGVALFMAILGKIVRYTYTHSSSSASSALVYICLFTISAYYPRAAFVEPSRLIVWSLIMYRLTFRYTPIQNNTE